jgi:hypothetical protein
VDEVSEAELLECVGAGRMMDCANGGGARRVVAAELVRRLCRQLADQVDPRGIRMKNALVAGELDIAGLDIPFPLRFEACEFESPVMAEAARLNGLAVTGSVLPGLLANGLLVRRDLDLSRTHVVGSHPTSASDARLAAVWLCESEIGGRLLCSGTTIRADGERALQADHMRTGGAVRFLRQFTAHGEIRLLGARLGGSLDLIEASLRAPGGIALDLTDADVGGSLFIITSDIRGRVDMSSARVAAQFLVRDAALTAPADPPSKAGYSRFRDSGTAVSAPRLTVGAEITLEHDCRVTGGIDLSMGTLSSLLIDSGCRMQAPGKTALDLTNAEVLSAVAIGEDVPVEGTLRLAGAAIHGSLRLRKTRLSAPAADGILIAAEGARIDGDVQLREMQADGGELSFRASVIGGAVDAVGACLRNPDGYTLSLVQANISGSVRLTYGFESAGKVIMNRAIVQGRLLCALGSFHCPAPSERNRRGHAIEAISANIAAGMDLAWRSVSPSADFTNARTAFLADDPARWPARFLISGFTYDRLEQPQGLPAIRTWDHAARSAWLSRQAVYDAGPYEQAARVFRQHGYTDGARAILIAQRRHARSAITGPGAAPRRALDTAYDVTVGYGYRPARVAWLIAALLILVTITLQVPGARAAMRATTSAGAVYTPAGPLQPQGTAAGGTAAARPRGTDACGEGQVRCFNPVFYAIDTVIPLVSLDQRATWYPDPSTSGGTVMQWWLNIASILGWLLSSIFVLALASFARSM